MDHAKAIGKDDFFMFGEVFEGDPKNLAPYVRDTEIGGVLDFAFAGNAANFARGTTAKSLSSFFATDDLYTTPHSSAADLEPSSPTTTSAGSASCSAMLISSPSKPS